MSYSVRTPLLFWLGAASLLFLTYIVIDGWGHWMLLLGLTAVFGGCGAVLLLMSAEICGDDEALTVKRLHNEARIRWDEIVKIVEGGGNLVFYTRTGRVSAPSFEFWVGSQRTALLTLLQSKLEERQIPVRFGSFRAMWHVGDR
jgi:hypothetical protein